MVLVSAALVVVATITLVIGLLGTGLSLIYVSIGCSVLAGIVLAVAVLRGRPEDVAAPTPAMARPTVTPPVTSGVGSWEPTGAPLAAPGPAYASAPDEAPTRVATGTALAGATFGGPGESTAGEAEGGYSSAVARLRERARSRRGSGAAPAMPPDGGADAPPDAGGVGMAPDAGGAGMAPDAGAVGDDDFPIAGYDDLRASEILRLIPDLDPSQLEAVRAREAAGMNRFTVVSRIDARLAEATGGWDAAEQGWGADDEEWAGTGEELPGEDDMDADIGVEDDMDAGVMAGVGEAGEGDFEAVEFGYVEEEVEVSGQGEEGAPVSAATLSAADRLAARMAARAERAGGGTAARAERAGAKKAGATKAGATKAGATRGGAKKAGATKAGAKRAGATRGGAKKAGATRGGAKKAGTRRGGRAAAAWVEPTGDACPASHPVKVKVRSGIYHVEGGRDYDRTTPDRCYANEAAAKRDGLRRSKR